MAATPSFAATITVDTTTDEINFNGNCSLREAVINANNDDQSGSVDCTAGAGTDTITVPAGTYTLNIGASDEDAAADGDLDITAHATINGAGAGSTIIDGNGAERVFHITGAFTVNFSGVTIQNGKDVPALNGGGGIYNNTGTVTITNSAISGNNGSVVSGGGIRNNGGTMTITYSTVSGNNADGGGGIVNDTGGTVTITNSTISGNTSTNVWGGGTYNVGTMTITNSTISGNSSNGAGGGSGVRNTGTLHLTNTIVANGSAGDSDCINGGGGTISTNVNNLIEDNSCGGIAALSGDPSLAALANNGGTTETHTLNAGSSAIDAGNNGSCPTDDQRGNTRTDGLCDIGAYEYIATTVTTQAVTSIAVTTATGNGNITALGDANPTAHGVVWSTSTGPTTSDSKTDAGATAVTGAFTGSLTGVAGTTYYVKAYATNGYGTYYGAEVTFTTLSSPTVTTQAVSSIASTTATGNGNITDLGSSNPTAHGVVWSTSTGPTTSDSKTDEGAASATGAFTSSMTGLSAGTTYYVKAYATNSVGTSYGGEVSFTTTSGGSAPEITVTDSIAPIDDLSLPYGSVRTGNSSDKKVIVTNDGTEDLIIGNIAQSNSLSVPFSIIADNCSNKTLPAGGNCTLYLRFSPTAAGTFNDSFDIPSNDSDESTVTFSVSGTGTDSDEPDITVTDSTAPKNDLTVPFGKVTVDYSSDSVVAVTNAGSTFLDIGILGFSDSLSAPFSIVNDNCTEQSLDTAQSCTFTVRFSPTAAGTFNDSFEIPSNDPDESSVTVSVSGTGTTDPVPNISVIPTEVSFNVSVGSSSSAQTITIENNGPGDLTISTISLAGTDTSEFSIQNDNCSGQTIASSGDCTVEVVFSPTSSGEKSANLTIPSDDPGTSSAEVSLTGNPSITNATATSSNATILYYIVSNSIAGSSSSFTSLISISFTATDVEDTADLTFTFSSLPGSPVIYKEVGGTWKEIYPSNNCDGITNVTLSSSNKTLSFTLEDNSECDNDSTTGTIQDPVVLGEEYSSNGSGGGGGGGFFIAIAAFLLLVGGFCRKAASCRNQMELPLRETNGKT